MRGEEPGRIAAPCWAAPGVTVTETFDGTIDEAAWRGGSRGDPAVGRASFHLGEPDQSYPVQAWSLGFDNPRITLGKGGTGPTIAAITSPPV